MVVSLLNSSTSYQNSYSMASFRAPPKDGRMGAQYAAGLPALEGPDLRVSPKGNGPGDGPD